MARIIVCLTSITRDAIVVEISARATQLISLALMGNLLARALCTNTSVKTEGNCGSLRLSKSHGANSE